MLSIFFGSFLIGFSGAVAPGPLTAIAISQSSVSWKRSLYLILGHISLEGVIVTLLVFGFQKFLKNPFFVSTLSIGGGIFLFYMGISLFVNTLKNNNNNDTNYLFSSASLPLIGIIVSLSNPYFLLWWITVGGGFMTKIKTDIVAGALVFYIGHILSDISWYILLGILGQSLFKPSLRKIYKGILIVSSGILIVFAVFFIVSVFR